MCWLCVLFFADLRIGLSIQIFLEDSLNFGLFVMLYMIVQIKRSSKNDKLRTWNESPSNNNTQD